MIDILNTPGKGRKPVTWVVRPDTGCWECDSHKPHHSGYTMLKRHAYKGALHRLMYMRANGPIPDRLFIRHKCDNPRCINPDHLEPGTPADNVRDRVERGRGARGERAGRARLTEAQVRMIRSSNRTAREWAEKFGVGVSTVQFVKQRRSWRHIP